ncbi:hypothetical protein PNOK_0159200 [Pyrrhoderma noxium]|uniref:Uncharacterized protein n=1 Tax=Pyrrhoderma noxium TaxID=2282107 RepID=A0A286UQ85_9AGAM|nr:hypothetical protein PNOK_0159200 [Pyrrhoderma noxium]
MHSSSSSIRPNTPHLRPSSSSSTPLPHRHDLSPGSNLLWRPATSASVRVSTTDRVQSQRQNPVAEQQLKVIDKVILKNLLTVGGLQVKVSSKTVTILQSTDFQHYVKNCSYSIPTTRIKVIKPQDKSTKKIHLLSKLVPGSSKQKREVPRTWTGTNVENAVYKAIYDILTDFINHVALEIKLIKKEIAKTTEESELDEKRQCLEERGKKMAFSKKLQKTVLEMRKKVTDSAWSDADEDFEIEIKAPKPQPETEPITAS